MLQASGLSATWKLEFKHPPTIGRTHRIHAEPATFGLKLLNWYAEIERGLPLLRLSMLGIRTKPGFYKGGCQEKKLQRERGEGVFFDIPALVGQSRAV